MSVWTSKTGEVMPLSLVTDNGAAFKATRFKTFIESLDEIRHVRTRHHAPETNGVVERFNSPLTGMDNPYCEGGQCIVNSPIMDNHWPEDSDSGPNGSPRE
jgi:transposase InsO family protein